MPTGGQSEGPATDAGNNPVVDPTKNVLDLVEAAVERLDDLREKESEHLRELIVLRANHNREMRDAESGRINAIRQVDVQAVQQAATVASTQASTLAAQVASSAEALRNQVAAAASAQTIALAAALEPIIKDIADLRRAQYEAQGQKTQVIETRGNSNAVVGAVIGGIGLLIAIISIVVAVAVGGG
jgi:ribosomal protein L18